MEQQTHDVLERAESFISGFEGDEIQEGIDQLLADIRAILRPAATPRPIIAVVIEGGMVQGVYSDDPERAKAAIGDVVVIDYDTDGADDDDLTPVPQARGGTENAIVAAWELDGPLAFLPKLSHAIKDANRED